MITKEQLKRAYTERYGAILPAEDSAFDSFIQRFGLDRDLEQSLELLYDYVGSQGLYLEGAEESW